MTGVATTAVVRSAPPALAKTRSAFDTARVTRQQSPIVSDKGSQRVISRRDGANSPPHFLQIPECLGTHWVRSRTLLIAGSLSILLSVSLWWQIYHPKNAFPRAVIPVDLPYEFSGQRWLSRRSGRNQNDDKDVADPCHREKAAGGPRGSGCATTTGHQHRTGRPGTDDQRTDGQQLLRGESGPGTGHPDRPGRAEGLDRRQADAGHQGSRITRRRDRCCREPHRCQRHRRLLRHPLWERLATSEYVHVELDTRIHHGRQRCRGEGRRTANVHPVQPGRFGQRYRRPAGLLRTRPRWNTRSRWASRTQGRRRSRRPSRAHRTGRRERRHGGHWRYRTHRRQGCRRSCR